MPRQCIADLAREFENGELEPDRFRHADHVRVAWALLKHADAGAGDPADARFRVAEATADHHNL